MKILAESQLQKDKFRTAANKLLNTCFIIKKKEDTRNDYMFIAQHKDLFLEYFDLLGYTLDINEMHGVISLISLEGTGRLRLKKVDSIILLIFRLLYIEKLKELRLADDVIVLTDEIHQKYDMLQIDTKPSLDKTTLREAVRLFRRYNLISTIDRDITLSDARIRIFPSVLFAIPSMNLDTMYEAIQDKLNQYVTGGEPDDEEIDQDQTD